MSYEIPEDVECGKNWADKVLQDFIEKYNVGYMIKKCEWKYNPDHFYYFLRITIREPRGYKEAKFQRNELTSMDKRSELMNKIRDIVKSLTS